MCACGHKQKLDGRGAAHTLNPPLRAFEPRHNLLAFFRKRKRQTGRPDPAQGKILQSIPSTVVVVPAAVVGGGGV